MVKVEDQIDRALKVSGERGVPVCVGEFSLDSHPFLLGQIWRDKAPPELSFSETPCTSQIVRECQQEK